MAARRAIEPRKAALRTIVLVAGALGAVLVAGALWLVFRPAPEPPKQAAIEPAEETTATTLPPAPSSLTTTAGLVPGEQAPPPASVPSAGFTRAKKIAFRIGDTLYVANEDGAAPARVARSKSGPYVLSPDAKTIALIDGTTLVFVDVASGKSTKVGAAEMAHPVWTPDSKAVYFVRQKQGSDIMEVWRAERGSAKATLVHQGVEASVSPDGRVLVVRPMDGEALSPDVPGTVAVSEAGGPFRAVPVPGFPLSVAAGDDVVFVGLASNSGESRVVSMKLDGTGVVEVLGKPSEAQASWADLMLSPDGRYLAAAASGDDGFSRIMIAPTTPGVPRTVTRRRDGYLSSWSATGDALFFLEGNYFQGETATLTRIRPDASKRAAVITGVEP